MKTKMPVSSLNGIYESDLYQSEEINNEILDFYGVFIVRGFLSEFIEDYIEKFNDFRKSDLYQRTKFHLTEVKITASDPLRKILFEPKFLNLTEKIYPSGVGLHSIRLVTKDPQNTSPVFLHQDIGYCRGGLDRYSFFIPLAECSEENGGLSFIPGTHHFGYLGDVGEINKNAIPAGLKILTPSVQPGDVIIMNSSLWHSSNAYLKGPDRIYYDIQINPISDPSTVIGLNGKEINTDWRLNYENDFLFSNSRAQKLRKLYDTEG